MVSLITEMASVIEYITNSKIKYVVGAGPDAKRVSDLNSRGEISLYHLLTDNEKKQIVECCFRMRSRLSNMMKNQFPKIFADHFMDQFLNHIIEVRAVINIFNNQNLVVHPAKGDNRDNFVNFNYSNCLSTKTVSAFHWWTYLLMYSIKTAMHIIRA